MPPSCALLGGFAISALVALLVLALCLVVHCGCSCWEYGTASIIGHRPPSPGSRRRCGFREMKKPATSLYFPLELCAYNVYVYSPQEYK